MSRAGSGTLSGVVRVRVVDVLQLEKISWRLDMAESCSWWLDSGASEMEQEKKLRACTMQSDGDTVGWVR